MAFTPLGPNPGFETNTAGWSAWVGTVTRDTNVKRTGAASGRYNVPADTWWGGLEYFFEPPALGQAVTYRVWIRTGAADLGATLRVLSRDAADVTVAEASTPVTPTSNAWQSFTVQLTAPEPDCSVIVEFDTGSAIQVWVDDVEAELVAGGPVPVAGTSQAVSGASGQVTARKRLAGAVQAVSGASGRAAARLAIAGVVAAVSGASGAITVTPAEPVVHAVAGTSSAVSGASGTVTVPGGRPYFQAADWYWDPIPPSPVLHDKNSTWSGYLAAGQHPANLDEYANAIVYFAEIDGSTPRYSVAVDNAPAWGPNPFAGYQVPVPAAAQSRVVPFTGPEDSWLIIADPQTNRVFHLWQARWTGSTWRASWGGVSDIAGDGRDDITGSGLSNFGGTIRLAALQEAAANNTGLGHALQFSSDATAGSLESEFVYPATKTDGHLWTQVVADPIWQGTRVQLDPSIDVDAIAGITAAEKVIAKTLQTHGAYLIDNGGARAAWMFERQANGNIAAYSALGLGWDYYDLAKIPWSSMRVLRHWHGGATLEQGASAPVAGTSAAVSGASGQVTARRSLAGASAGVSGASGRLAESGLAGVSAAVSGASGRVTARARVAGAAAAVSGASGRVDGGETGPPPPPVLDWAVWRPPVRTRAGWAAQLMSTVTGETTPPLTLLGGTWTDGPLNAATSGTVTVPVAELRRFDDWWWSEWSGSVLLSWMGAPVVAGPILADPSGWDTVELRFGGLFSLLDHRYATDRDYRPGMGAELAASELNYSGMNLGGIAADLTWRARDKPFGAFPFRVASPNEAGVVDRVRNYKGHNISNLSVAKLVREITEVINGPDVAYRPEWVQPGSRAEWVMYHGTEGLPQISQDRPHRIDLTAPRARLAEPVIRKETTQVFRAYVTGQGEGPGTEMVIAERGSGHPAYLPALETVHSDSQATNAHGLLDERGAALVTPTETVQLSVSLAVDDPVMPLTSWFTGDEFEVRVPDLLHITAGVYRMRVVSRSGSVASTVVKVELQPEEMIQR